MDGLPATGSPFFYGSPALQQCEKRLSGFGGQGQRFAVTLRKDDVL
jgi:hypothetical protein